MAQYPPEIIQSPTFKQKILFVADASSSHTQSWVRLLDNSGFDIKVFGVGGTQSPEYYPYDIISTVPSPTRSKLSNYLSWRTGMFCKSIRHDEFRLSILELLAKVSRRPDICFNDFECELLASTIKQWKPDIIHTLGIISSAIPYQVVRKRFCLESIGSWVVSAWGGSDFDLVCHDPSYVKQLVSVVKECDYFIADNEPAYRHAKYFSLNSSKIIDRGVTPGAGGVEVDRLRSLRSTKPSRLRTILIPKAYECPFSKVLPVFEAIKLCWKQISPCNLIFTACNEEAKAWFRDLPENIKSCSEIEDRIPHEQLLDIMAKSRMVLAPSLIDGIPNTLYETMATGAFPIFSPLETFSNIMKDGQSILYAHNLFPNQIAEALVKAMNDDALVDSASDINLQLVRSLAERSDIQRDVIKFYNSI